MNDTTTLAIPDETPPGVVEEEAYKQPENWQSALDSLYIKYATDPTPKQRIKILEAALGLTNAAYSIESTSDWRTPVEEIEFRNMRVLELDYLELIGLHSPHYC
jgi:hypothetical protein